MSSDPDARAEALLDQMTLDEQIGLLSGHMPSVLKPRPEGIQRSAGWVPGLRRLGIPDLFETDASLGVSAAGRRDDQATALPSGLALASSWSPELAEEAGAMIAGEARAKGFNCLLAGGVNLTREPRNGRNFEYLGEDPLLAGVLCGASIRGIQARHIVSTIKHFALNSQETGRMVMSAHLDEAAFRESDLLAFQIAIEAGQPGSVMCAYNRVDGTYASENAWLLTDVLRGDWGYKGWVMSDWGAVHSAAPAANAGLDQQSGREFDVQPFFVGPLKDAVVAGEVPTARIREMAHRYLRSMLACGVFEHPVSNGTPDLAAGAAVTRRAAEAGVVLLKNDGLLPLEGVRRIAVIGGKADIGVMSGGGSSQVVPQGSTRFDPPPGAPRWTAGVIYQPDPPLEAIRARAANVQVAFDDGADPARAAKLAAESDVAIVFAVEWATEAVDTTLVLPDGQDALIAAVAAANRRTVVALETGNPVFMPWLGDVGAVVEAWYPGSEGGKAIAAVLFGDVNPAGRLPITFPASTEALAHKALPGGDLPIVNDRGDTPPFDVDYVEGADVGYRWYARTGARPLFPFGFGLSYTTFRYANLAMDGLAASFDVTNAGARTGIEVAQLYLTGAPGRDGQRLLGWARVALEPGETRRVTVDANPRLLADWSLEARAFVIAGGEYRVAVGPDAATRVLEGATTLLGGRVD
ncbi:MAG: glycoside hydrolase family 3 C-terminal domain-containing protein [Phenylobacterium sp.]|uniref:beta-glucosidase n=1 Tax=Phenylobacterium sp. TaxID=1871053 RepID=UPI001A50B883|nr:glycoside hydrolase family 3 C-terminal domain-containing protein [Phenylobacterium sp.]MBL8553533.1 glycoside hydrolase family 3 C-terminal domain-containing protein [Phenylobacterium sp.]